MIDDKRLAAYVKSANTDLTYVARCAEEAERIVAEALRGPDNNERSIPPDLRDRAALEVGAELWARRGLKNGVATFGAGDDGLTPVHVPRDPMHLARAILAPFLGGPFA